MLLTIRFYLSRCCQLGCLLLAVSTVALASDERAAAIGLLPDIKNDYLLFMAGRKPADVDYYGGPHARRDVAELVLLQQALDLGGFNQRIVFIEEENYFRSIRNAVEGKTLTMSGTIWLQDLEAVKEKIFISQALVRDGEFVVGVYTSPRNRKALASKTLAELTQLRVVSSRQWKPDLRALESLGFQHIMYTPNWVNMVRMINAGRVDLTLAPFGLQENMHIAVEGIDLAPVPGIKIMIPGSRHWPVSRKHPLGQEFYAALEKGLQQLRAKGTIERAYRECGFFHSAVTDWTLLNKQITD
jgi:hypothetical protein